MAKTDLTVRRVYEWIDALAPFETCESWDNSGLLAGSMEQSVAGVYCALDVSSRVIEDALEKGCDLLVTHHPILFGGRKNLREDDEEGRMLCRLVREKIAVISAHTNFDKAVGGVNDVLARKLGIQAPMPIEGDEEGFVRIGAIEPMTLGAFVRKVKDTLGDAVRAYGDAEQTVKTIAVCGGAGGEFALLALQAGADAYVTGEMRYHDSLDLAQRGFATLQAGHDATEKIAVSALRDEIAKRMEAEDLAAPVCLSDLDIFSLRQI